MKNKKSTVLISLVLSLLFLQANTGVIAQSLSGGYFHSSVLCSDSTVWSVGKNDLGTLGDGTGVNSASFVEAKNLPKVTMTVSGANHQLALDENGRVWSWGHNNSGQLGLGNTDDLLEPQMISSLENIIFIAAGENNSFAVRADGSLFAWGKNNQGQLGTGDKTQALEPVLISSINKVKKVAAGQSHTLVLTQGGEVYSVGFNQYGQLGIGNNDNQLTPTLVASISSAKGIDVGVYHSLILKEDGTVWSFGYNGNGELGLADVQDRNIPTQISALTEVQQIEVGQMQSFAKNSNNKLFAWGNNYYGQVGNGTSANLESPIEITSDVELMGAGLYHSMAKKSDETLMVWGYNYYNQLGDGTTTTQLSPVQVNPGCSVKKIGPICPSIADFTVAQTEACIGETLDFLNQSQNAYEFKWRINQEEQGTEENFSKVFDAAGEFELELIVNEFGCPANKRETIIVHEIPNTQIVSVDAVCEGGELLLSASVVTGGFLWSTGENANSIVLIPTETTEYSLTYTDVYGCKNTATKQVNFYNNPIAQISGNTAYCEGESITLEATGGNAFEWESGETSSVFSTVAADDFSKSVTVTDNNGCNATATQAVVVNQIPDFAIAGNDLVCEGSEISLAATDGFANYAWSDGTNGNVLSKTAIGNEVFYLTVTTAEGCSSVQQFAVEITGLPTATINGQTNYCVGETMMFVASGGDSYDWSSGENTAIIEPVASTQSELNVVVTDANGCASTASLNLVIIDVPNVDFTYTLNYPEMTFSNMSINADSYVWEFGDGNASTQTNPTHAFVEGTYDVVLKAYNSCGFSATTQSVTIIGTGVEELVFTLSAQAFPNPSNGQFTLEINSPENEKVTIEIYDATGKKVHSIVKLCIKGNNTFGMDYSWLASGRYEIRVVQGKAMKSQVIIKQ